MPCKHTSEAKCPLCEAIAEGKPLNKKALLILNLAQNNQPKPKTRICPICDDEVKELVSRDGRHICESCAEKLDDED